MNILWFGSIIDSSKLSLYPQQSPASNLWQIQQITGLSKLDNTITVFSHIPRQTYPYSHLISSDTYKHTPIFNKNIAIKQKSYLNIKHIKDINIAISYIYSLIKDLKEHDIAVFYNNSPHHRLVAKFIKSVSNIKCIEIIADDKDSPVFDGHIYLSWWYYTNSIHKNKFFFDQPMINYEEKSTLSFKKYEKHKNITYSGTLSKWGGITEFSNQFIKLTNEHEELKFFILQITGHGTPDQQLLKLVNHPNIKFHGFVDEDKLENILQESDFFVNPRPLLDDNKRNFPSKITTYLKYKKPILSTKTAGLSPKYNDILFFFDPESDESLKFMLYELRQMSSIDMEILASKLNNFIKENSTNILIPELNSFLEKQLSLSK